MKISSAYPQRELTFCVLAPRLNDVRLVVDSVEGDWDGGTRSPLFWSRSAPSVAEDFANSGDEADILRFTRKYGPLRTPVKTKSGRVSFSLKEWRHAQHRFREMWKTLVYRRGQPIRVSGPRFVSEPGEGFRFYNGNWEYRASTLERFLQLELIAIRIDYLRVCARPHCQNPFFLARDPRQEYCSETCGNEAQKASKRQWWREKGDPLRRKRAARAKAQKRRRQS